MEFLVPYISLFVVWLPILLTLLTVFHYTFQIFKWIKSLYVEGQANEWVLILNDGNLKQAGIGLSCFRGPFDQVARFPSKVHKVNFQT